MKKWWDEITFLKVDALGASLCSSGRGRFGPIQSYFRFLGGDVGHGRDLINRLFLQVADHAILVRRSSCSSNPSVCPSPLRAVGAWRHYLSLV
jgi:hypothetical protein